MCRDFNILSSICFSIDMKDERIVVNTIADQLVIKGNHTANGRILVLPVKGSGPFSMIFGKKFNNFYIIISNYFFKDSYE